MFSFFKKKKSNDDVLAKGMALNQRINRLRSVNFEFIQSMLELTDNVTDRIRELYKQFPAVNGLEVDAFCASMVCTGIISSDVPENEAPEVLDIYLGLWTETAVKNHPGASEQTLRVQMNGLWIEYCRMILKTLDEPTPQIVINEDSVARVLVRNVDRLARVDRDSSQEAVTAVTFKATIGEVIRIVAALVSDQERGA